MRLRPILAPNALREDRCQDCPKDRPKGKARVDQGHTSASEGIEDAVEQSHQHPSIDDTNRRATRQTDPSDRQRLAPQEGADLSRLRAQRQQDRLGSGGIDAARGKWSGKLTHTSLRSCQQKAASFFDKSGMDKMMFLPCAHGVRGGDIKAFAPQTAAGRQEMRILLIEDDRMIGESLVRALGREGMSVDWARNAADGAEGLANGGHALVLLDLGLPGGSGIDLLKRARAEGADTPVVIVTARDGLEDRIAGLDVGADDYVVKPFETRELLARMRAVMRRHAGAASSLLVAGEISLDIESHEVTYRGKATLLPAREFALMRALAERPGAIFSRHQIEERIYGWGEEVESNAVDVLIHSIRKKFDKDVIRNVRGAGWMIARGEM